MYLTYIPTQAYMMLSNWIREKNRVRNVIIDPLTCIIKLAVLSFMPRGTKISIAQNKIQYHHPNFFQGTWRFFQGDKREDLHNLYNPILKSIQWYLIENTDNVEVNNYNDTNLSDSQSSVSDSESNDNQDANQDVNQDVNQDANQDANQDSNQENNQNIDQNTIQYIIQNTNQLDINYLFRLAINGIHLLQQAYGNNSTIKHTLEYYVKLIENKGTTAIPSYNNENTENNNEENKRIHSRIHHKLRFLWSTREIKIAIELFKEYQIKEDLEEKEQLLETIKKFAEMKEQKVCDLLTEVSTIL